MLIYTRCRDGLNFGIQEIFSQLSPKPICETLNLFELLLSKKELDLKDFLKQYLPQIYEYTQNQFQEVRHSSLKLFVAFIKEFGESYVVPYKQKLKSNQIDFVNKQLQRDHQIQSNQNSILSQKDHSFASSALVQKSISTNANTNKFNGGLSSSASSSSLQSKQNQSTKLLIASQNPQLKQMKGQLSERNTLSKIKTLVTKLSPASSESQLKITKKKVKSKEESFTSMNDLSKSRSSINSKISKKKHSDTLSAVDNDSSYEKNSELSFKVSREYSVDLTTQKKKIGSVLDKIIKADLPEILEAGITDRSKKSTIQTKQKSISVHKPGNSVIINKIRAEKPPKPQSNNVSIRFKSESDLKLRKSSLTSTPKVLKSQIKKTENIIPKFEIETPNGVDDETYYANPKQEDLQILSESKEKFFSDKNSSNQQYNPLLDNTLQYSFSYEGNKGVKQEIQNLQNNQFQESIDFMKELPNMNIQRFNSPDKDKFQLALNDLSIVAHEEMTPQGVDNESCYAEPNLNADDDSDYESQEELAQQNSLQSSIENHSQYEENIQSNDLNKTDNVSQNNENQIKINKINNQLEKVEDNQEINKNNQIMKNENKDVKIINEDNSVKIKEDNRVKVKENMNATPTPNPTPNGIDNDDCYAEPKLELENSEIIEDTQPGDAMMQKQISIDVDKQKLFSENNGQDLVESVILQQKFNMDLLQQKSVRNDELQVVEEEEQNQIHSSTSMKKQLQDVSLQMSFINKQNGFENEGSNYFGDQNYSFKLSCKQESNDPYFNIEEEEKYNQSNFQKFQNDLTNQQKITNNEIRGYFFNQDLQDMLSVVESAEQKNYFFSQNQVEESGFNKVLQEKDIFVNDEKKKKNSFRSNQPSLSPNKLSPNLQRNQDEEREQAYQIISKQNQMNDKVLKSYMIIFNNKLVNKLNQQQKDKIIYIINKDSINQWFNQQEYDNVSIISFFILYLGKQFEKEDVSFLSRFWNFQKFLTFNNAMIQSETIHMMHTYFKVIQKYGQIKSRIRLRCLRDTINKLIKIIPVSRDKLFDEAFAFIDFIFELDQYNNYIFDAIAEVLQSNVPKQTVSSLRILSNFLRLYGERRLNSLKPFMYTIKCISFSANLQVRNAAIEFYQEAYSWMGDSIFEYTKSLKRSQLIQLEKAFSQVTPKDKRPEKCPEDVFCPIMNDDLYEKEQNIFFSQNDEEIQKQESYIRKALAVQEWVNKDDLLEKIVNDASCQIALKEQNYKNLTKILLELLGDWNKYIIENTLILIRSLSLKLKKDFCQGSIELFETVFELYSEQKSINRDKIGKALVSLFIVAGLSNLQGVIEKLFAKKRNIKELLNLLNFGLRKTDAGSVLKIIQDIQVFLIDKDSNTKIAAFDLFGMIRYLFGNPIIEQNLSAHIKNNKFILQKIQECHVKCAKMKCLSMQKKKLEDMKIASLSKSLSSNSEMSTASYDKQYFYVQLQNCSFSKKNQFPIQQFKIIKKQELLAKQLEESNHQSCQEIYQDSFVHEFLSQSQKKIHQLDDIDEI